MNRLTLLSLLTTACASTTPGVLPPRAQAAPPPELTLVWAGRGETERLTEGTWQRAPAFDYEFTVEQRRYKDHWESVKHLRRQHPDYDGSAGPREQTMFFALALAPADAAGAVTVTIDSTLGKGEGTTDRAFRTAALVFHPALSAFAPFDTYRIAQQYRYEDGALEELVSLDKGETPWVRNREKATLFAPRSFTEPPTLAR